MNSEENIIQIKNLSKSFNHKKAVDNISFSVRKGSIFAFLGPNGAGKSTTIKVMTTLLHADKGEVRINGHDLENSDAVRKSIGIVFQDQSVDEELTAYENIQFHAVLYNVPKKEMEKRIVNALRLVELYDRRNDLVKTFSGGMKRRLEIGRSLVHHPKILFLDEPTTGLDTQTSTKIWNYIKQLNKKEGTTIFLTTHYMPEAENVADEVAIIDKGKIVIQDTVGGIKRATKTKTLEKAYLKLTGKDIRDQNADNKEFMRLRIRG